MKKKKKEQILSKKTEFGLISTVIDVCENVEQVLDLTGLDSKARAMDMIKEVIGYETYKANRELIYDMIDFLCWVSKNGKALYINERTKRCFLKTLSCCK